MLRVCNSCNPTISTIPKSLQFPQSSRPSLPILPFPILPFPILLSNISPTFQIHTHSCFVFCPRYLNIQNSTLDTAQPIANSSIYLPLYPLIHFLVTYLKTSHSTLNPTLTAHSHNLSPAPNYSQFNSASFEPRS
jgi:hypothetical protein